MTGFILALCVLGLTGCSSWRQVPPDPDVVPPTHERMRVHTRDRRTIVLADAAVVGDSLLGRFEKSATPLVPPVAPGSRYAIAVADVERVEARRSDPAATVVVVLLLVATSVTLIVSDFNPIY